MTTINHDMLNVLAKPVYDDSIYRYEMHSFLPNTTQWDPSDEIHISINQQDIFTQPGESELVFKGTIKNQEDKAITTIEPVWNAIQFLMDEVRYEQSGVAIANVKNVGITSCIKNYLSCNDHDVRMLEMAGWGKNLHVDADGNFTCIIPLKTLMGFFEDYQRILLNVKQELILIRSNTNLNAICKKSDAVAHTDTDAKIKFTKIAWRMPFIHVNDVERMRLLNIINKNSTITMSFRSWDLFEYPQLQTTKKFNWPVLTTFNIERPRYVIVAFQTDRQKKLGKNACHFDHLWLENIKVYLNGEVYPYENWDLDFAKSDYAIAYSNYVKFQTSYYGKFPSEPMLSMENFKDHGPLYVIDCSRQSEALKTGQVDLRLEIVFAKDPPEKTAAYCLVIHDKIMQYNALANTVTKLV